MSSGTDNAFVLKTKLEQEKQGYAEKVKKGLLFKNGDSFTPTVFMSTKREGAKNGIVIWEYSEDKKQFVTPIKELEKQNFSIEQLEGVDHILTVLNHDNNIIVCLREEELAMESFKKMWTVGKVVKKKKSKKKDKSISKFSKLLQKKPKPVVEETEAKVEEVDKGVKPIQ